MTCAECDSLLIEHAYGELSPGTARKVEAHLATCERCAKAQLEIQRTLLAVRSLPEERPSDAGVPELLALAREVAQAAGVRQRPRQVGLLPGWIDHLLFRPGWALAAAAVTVGVFSLAVLELGRRSPVAESQLSSPTASAPPSARPLVPPAEPEAKAKASDKLEAVADEAPALKKDGAERPPKENKLREARRGEDADFEERVPQAGLVGRADDAKGLMAGSPARDEGAASPAMETKALGAAAPVAPMAAHAPLEMQEKRTRQASEPEAMGPAKPLAPAAAPPPVDPAVRAKEVSARAQNHADQVVSAAEEAAALFERAEQAQSENRLDDAYSFFVKLADSYPHTARAPDALLAAARIEDRRGHVATRDALLRRLAANYPGTKAASGALQMAPGR